MHSFAHSKVSKLHSLSKWFPSTMMTSFGITKKS
ncbi:unnamed protein product [Amoebophrya sp. A25]|nr:unnamed protein product [Amoebophrya sp. A25]|eukprot:GSA25T00009623001.1